MKLIGISLAALVGYAAAAVGDPIGDCAGLAKSDCKANDDCRWNRDEATHVCESKKFEKPPKEDCEELADTACSDRSDRCCKKSMKGKITGATCVLDKYKEAGDRCADFIACRQLTKKGTCKKLNDPWALGNPACSWDKEAKKCGFSECVLPDSSTISLNQSFDVIDWPDKASGLAPYIDRKDYGYWFSGIPDELYANARYIRTLARTTPHKKVLTVTYDPKNVRGKIYAISQAGTFGTATGERFGISKAALNAAGWTELTGHDMTFHTGKATAKLAIYYVELNEINDFDGTVSLPPVANDTDYNFSISFATQWCG